MTSGIFQRRGNNVNTGLNIRGLPNHNMCPRRWHFCTWNLYFFWIMRICGTVCHHQMLFSAVFLQFQFFIHTKICGDPLVLLMVLFWGRGGERVGEERKGGGVTPSPVTGPASERGGRILDRMGAPPPSTGQMVLPTLCPLPLSLPAFYPLLHPHSSSPWQATLQAVSAGSNQWYIYIYQRP